MGNKAIKYRLYPTKEQAVLFHKTFGCCRKVYNLMLADAIKSYHDTGKFVSGSPASYKNDYPYLREVDSLALAYTQLHLESAFNARFDKSRKRRNGFPKFKSAKHSRRSYTTCNQNGTVAVGDGFIRLPKAGRVKAIIHRLPEPDWKLKSATVSQDPDGSCYVSVLFEYDAVPVSYHADVANAIGLDYASDGLYVDSSGCRGSNHKYYRESHEKLAKAQRRLSGRKGSRKGEQKSNNYLKQLRRVNRIHKHIANQRLDHLHKLSTEIANQYDIVCVESLNMKSLANKGFGNGKATMDNGYGLFLSMLDYKLADRGKYLIKVSKWYPSSQICHACGSRHPEMKDLKIRRMACGCGCNADRDYNAAVNILREGLRIFHESYAAA